MAGIAIMFLTARMIAWYKAVDRMPVLHTSPAASQPSDGLAK
jgi:hypothetical protein